jgi:hypothetical protein
MSEEIKSDNVLFEKADKFLPSVSVDCIIMAFHEGALKIVLNRFFSHNQWMLPGGFVYKDESVDDAAYRILRERTSLNKIYLKQFYLFGDKNRTNLDENRRILAGKGLNTNKDDSHWLLQRFVSAGYYAFVEYSKTKICTIDDEEVQWFDIKEIPQLYSDHNNIIKKALSTIRSQLGYLPIGYELLPEKFTMTELRIIYETIMGEKLDRRNFQRKMLSTGIIYKLDEVAKKKGIKSTTLFSFDKDTFKKIMSDESYFFK